MLFSVDFPNRVAAVIVDFNSWWVDTMLADCRVAEICGFVTRVAKTPATDVESICVLAHEIFWVERVKPCLEEDIAEDDVLHGSVWGGLGRTGGGHGRAVRGHFTGYLKILVVD